MVVIMTLEYEKKWGFGHIYYQHCETSL